MTHLTVRIFICLIIHTQCCYGEVKEASTTSTCFLRPPNRFRGPPGFSGKPGKEKVILGSNASYFSESFNVHENKLKEDIVK